jgi:hypothetical protein
MFIVHTASGDVIKWDNGKYECDNKEMIEKIRKYGKKLYRFSEHLILDGSQISCPEDPESNQYSAYALLDMCVRIVDDDGNRPTAEELYGKLPDGSIP